MRLYISRNTAVNTVASTYTAPYVSRYNVGEKAFDVLYTDIQTYIDGKKVTSYNIGGQTIIYFNDLAVYGNVIYNDNYRKLDLFVDGLSYKMSYEVVKLVNEQRAMNGLSPLTENYELSDLARLKCSDMAQLGYFSHTSPTYGSPFDMMNQFGFNYRAAGENIAKGQRTPEEVVEGWMNSPGHRANILNKSFTHIGVGYVASGNYWTQMFYHCQLLGYIGTYRSLSTCNLHTQIFRSQGGCFHQFFQFFFRSPLRQKVCNHQCHWLRSPGCQIVGTFYYQMFHVFWGANDSFLHAGYHHFLFFIGKNGAVFPHTCATYHFISLEFYLF